MLTKEQALTAERFHVGKCERIEGPRGGVKINQEIWRRNGKTQTWKTRPDDYRVPVKHGLKNYADITPRNAHQVHVEADCPLNQRA